MEDINNNKDLKTPSTTKTWKHQQLQPLLPSIGGEEGAVSVNFDFSSLSDEFFYSTGQRQLEDKQQIIDELERQTKQQVATNKK